MKTPTITCSNVRYRLPLNSFFLVALAAIYCYQFANIDFYSTEIEITRVYLSISTTVTQVDNILSVSQRLN